MYLNSSKRNHNNNNKKKKRKSQELYIITTNTERKAQTKKEKEKKKQRKSTRKENKEERDGIWRVTSAYKVALKKKRLFSILEAAFYEQASNSSVSVQRRRERERETAKQADDGQKTPFFITETQRGSSCCFSFVCVCVVVVFVCESKKNLIQSLCFVKNQFFL